MRASTTLLILLVTASAATATLTLVRTKLGRPARGFRRRMAAFEVPVGERGVCQSVRAGNGLGLVCPAN